ncbi:MAG TPA: hypothetical protein VGM65_06115 [Candidatus Udaeobacter sp.]
MSSRSLAGGYSRPVGGGSMMKTDVAIIGGGPGGTDSTFNLPHAAR